MALYSRVAYQKLNEPVSRHPYRIPQSSNGSAFALTPSCTTLITVGVGSFHSFNPNWLLITASCSGLSSRKSIPCDPLPAIEGWSLSKRADAD